MLCVVKLSSKIISVIPRNLVYVFLFSTLIYVLAASIFGAALAQETGSVNVSVNGYDGTSVLTATLVDSSSHDVLENKTVNAASFSFSNLVLGKQYSIVVNYKGIDYTTPVTVNETSQKIAVNVSDVTDSDEGIVISLYQMDVERGDNNNLNVTEYIEFRNNGSSVVNNTSLKIAMPAGYTNFIWDQSCCFAAADFGFFFTPAAPLMPNATKTINFAYTLQPNTDEYQFSKLFYYDTGDVFVLVNPDGLQASNFKNLWEQGSVPDGDGSLNVYGASSFYKGESVSIDVTGYKGGIGLNIVWVGTGVLAAVIVGAVVYSFRGNRVSVEKLKTEETALNSVLKQINKDYAAKKLSEVEYYKLRLKYKEKLERIRKRIREQKGK
jgi:hypothetical protein